MLDIKCEMGSKESVNMPCPLLLNQHQCYVKLPLFALVCLKSAHKTGLHLLCILNSFFLKRKLSKVAFIDHTIILDGLITSHKHNTENTFKSEINTKMTLHLKISAEYIFQALVFQRHHLFFGRTVEAKVYYSYIFLHFQLLYCIIIITENFIWKCVTLSNFLG